MKMKGGKRKTTMLKTNHVKTVKNEVANKKRQKIPLEVLKYLSNENLTSRTRGLRTPASIARYRKKKSKKPHKVKKNTLFFYIYFFLYKNIYKIEEVKRYLKKWHASNRLLERVCVYLSKFFHLRGGKNAKTLQIGI